MSIYVKLCNQPAPHHIDVGNPIRLADCHDCQQGVTKWWFNRLTRFLWRLRGIVQFHPVMKRRLFVQSASLLDTFIKIALKKVEQLDTTIHDHSGAY